MLQRSALLIGLLTLFIAACGTSQQSGLSTTGVSPSSFSADLNLQFVNQSEDEPLARLPVGADTYTVQVFSDRGLVREESFGRVSGALLNALPPGPVLVRLLLTTNSGVVGYSDRSVVLGFGANQLTFDTLLAGQPPEPVINLSTEPAKLGFLTHPRDVNEGVQQFVDVVVLAGDGSRVFGFPGEVELTASQGSNFGLQRLTGVYRAVVSFGAPAQNVRLTANSPGLQSAESLPFNVNRALFFEATTFPTTGNANIVFASPIVLSIKDSMGNLVTDLNSPVTARLGTVAGSSPSAQLQGTTTVNPVNGIVTFSDLSISEEGPYAIDISADGVTSFRGVVQVGPQATTGLLSVLDLTTDGVFLVNNASLADGTVSPTTINLPPGTPHGLAVDTQRNRAYVGMLDGSILVYNDASTLSGSTPPDATVTLTGVTAGFGLYFDEANDRLYFATHTNESLAVIDNASTLTGGNIAPTRLLTDFGKSTRYSYVDGRGRLLVTTSSAGSSPGDGRLFIFPDAASVNGDITSATRVELEFAGRSLMGIGLSADDSTAYIADFPGSSLISVDVDNPSSGMGTVQNEVVGGNTQISNSPRGVFVDQFRQEVYVAVGSAGRVVVFPETSDGDVGPARTLEFPASSHLSGLFIDFTRM